MTMSFDRSNAKACAGALGHEIPSSEPFGKVR